MRLADQWWARRARWLLLGCDREGDPAPGLERSKPAAADPARCPRIGVRIDRRRRKLVAAIRPGERGAGLGRVEHAQLQLKILVRRPPQIGMVQSLAVERALEEKPVYERLEIPGHLARID